MTTDNKQPITDHTRTMPKQIESRILDYLRSQPAKNLRPRHLARELKLSDEQQYHAFRDALRELMHEGRVVLGRAARSSCPSRPRAPRASSETIASTNGASASWSPPTPPATRTCSFPRAPMAAPSPAMLSRRRSPAAASATESALRRPHHRDHRAHPHPFRRDPRPPARPVARSSRWQLHHRSDPHARRGLAPYQAGHEGRR